MAAGRDTALALGLILVCALVIWGSRGLKSGGFEPLGPGAFPIGLAVLITALVGTLWLKSWRSAAGTEAAGEPPSTPWMPVALIGLAVAFTAALNVVNDAFAALSFGFLILAMAILTRFRLRALPGIAVVAAVTAFGTEFLFTRVLVVALP